MRQPTGLRLLPRALVICLLAACISLLGSNRDLRADPAFDAIQPVIYSGVQGGSNANLTTTASRFDGVGSLDWTKESENATEYIVGSGVLISNRYVLTAAHVFDAQYNGWNGQMDATAGDVKFHLNGVTASLSVKAITVCPGFAGFDHPSADNLVHEDLALLTLDDVSAQAVSDANIPTYSIFAGDPLGRKITMVGYGDTGNGVGGQANPPSSLVTKRAGWNMVDNVWEDDDASGSPGQPARDEMYVFDFDGPAVGDKNWMGGTSLGWDQESQLGPGDSGGPAFVELSNDQLSILGIDTFIGIFNFRTHPYAARYGGGGGGTLANGYLPWIQSVMSVTGDAAVVVVPAPGAFALGLLGLALVRGLNARRKS